MFEIKPDGNGTVRLSGALTVRDVEAFHSEFEKVLADGDYGIIDCSGVTDIDTAGLQVLAALNKSFLETSRQIEYITSPIMKESIALLGLKKLFRTV